MFRSALETAVRTIGRSWLQQYYLVLQHRAS